MKSLKITFFILLIILLSNIETNAQVQDMAQFCKTTNLNGLVTKTSELDFETTYTKLKSIIDKNPNLKIIFELDHQKNAASVDLELPPARVIFFGNPKMGTPLMQSSLITGIDLPQKVMVYQNTDDKIKVSYNDPAYLKIRHNIANKDAVLEKISGALDKITNMAIKK